jgi:hypothetical protein
MAANIMQVRHARSGYTNSPSTGCRSLARMDKRTRTNSQCHNVHPCWTFAWTLRESDFKIRGHLRYSKVVNAECSTTRGNIRSGTIRNVLTLKLRFRSFVRRET